MNEQEAIKRLEYIKHVGNGEQEYKHCAEEIALDMAIEALEKQIPKKVIEERWIYTRCDCGHEFSVHHGDGYYSIPYEEKTNYCPDCGQKLDWTVEE